MARLILLDRDGVINFDSADYIKGADEWTAIPGAIRAIARLKRSGWQVAVCTNQAGVGRGLLSEADLAEIHRKLADALEAEGVALDALTHCPHHPDDGCECRKPRPGMLLAMMARLHASPTETFYVGDDLKDVEAAQNAGCTPVLVRTGHGSEVEQAARARGVTWVADDLAAFTEALLEETSC